MACYEVSVEYLLLHGGLDLWTVSLGRDFRGHLSFFPPHLSQSWPILYSANIFGGPFKDAQSYSGDGDATLSKTDQNFMEIMHWLEGEEHITNKSGG